MEDLRSINKQQSTELKLMESEVQTLQGKMLDLEYLEQDVREMLDSGAFAGQPVPASREHSQSSRGGGRNTGASEGLNISIGGFFADKESFRERKQEWDVTYRETKNVAGELLAKVDAVEKNMTLVKSDLAKRKDYLESRPIGFPVAGRITSGFGPRRSPFSGGIEIHPGVDIAASCGSPVTATAKGVVIFAGYRSGYGNTVVIRHKFGFVTLYGHNSSITVHTGQKVARGKLIARVGSTGSSTGPHVHYEVHLNGVRVDPAPYL